MVSRMLLYCAGRCIFSLIFYMAAKEYSRRLYVRMMIVSILLSIAKASPDEAGHCQFSKDGTDIIVKVIINRSHFDKVDVKSFSIFKGRGIHQDRMVFYKKPFLVPKCAYNYENASWCNAGILPSTTTTEKSIELNINLTASPFAESLPLNIKLDADGRGNFESAIPLICSIPVNLNHTAVVENIKRNVTPTPNPAFMSGDQQSLSTIRNGPAEKSIEPNSTGTTTATPIEGTNSTASPISTARPKSDVASKRSTTEIVAVPLAVVLPVVILIGIVVWYCKKTGRCQRCSQLRSPSSVLENPVTYCESKNENSSTEV